MVRLHWFQTRLMAVWMWIVVNCWVLVNHILLGTSFELIHVNEFDFHRQKSAFQFLSLLTIAFEHFLRNA